MLKTSVLLAAAILVLCESAKINGQGDKKCSIKDDQCLQSLYRSFVQEAAVSGFPELDIPIIDPFTLKDMTTQVLGLLNFTLIEGTAKGYKTCYSTSFKNDIETGHTLVEFMCDVFTIEGTYTMESTPALLAFIGGINVHGKGTGGVTLEKLKMNFDFAYDVKKHDDGELHFNFKPEESSVTFDILGKATVTGDGVFVGKQDISTVAINIINENWKAVTKIVGDVVVKTALDTFYLYAQKFFDNVPVKDLITEDLSSYVH